MGTEKPGRPACPCGDQQSELRLQSSQIAVWGSKPEARPLIVKQKNGRIQTASGEAPPGFGVQAGKRMQRVLAEDSSKRLEQ